MFGAPCIVLSISDLTVFRVAETITLKSAKVLSCSDLRVTRNVLDLDYSLMLIKHTDLDLETVILLDRVQKHNPISAEAVKMLRSYLLSAPLPNFRNHLPLSPFLGDCHFAALQKLSPRRSLASIPEINLPKTKNQPQERLVIYIINQLGTRNSSGILL